jgi:hypothetical protein
MNGTVSSKTKKPSLIKALLHAFSALGMLMAAVVVIVVAAPNIDPSAFGYAVGQAGFFLFFGVFLLSYFIQRFFKKFLPRFLQKAGRRRH